MKLRQDITSYSIKELETIIKKLSDAYYNQKPLVSDQTFDSLVDGVEGTKPGQCFTVQNWRTCPQRHKKGKTSSSYGKYG